MKACDICGMVVERGGRLELGFLGANMLFPHPGDDASPLEILCMSLNLGQRKMTVEAFHCSGAQRELTPEERDFMARELGAEYLVRGMVERTRGRTMRTKTTKLKVNVDPELIGAIVANAVADGLLCERCTSLINSRVKAEQRRSRTESAFPAKLIINHFLEAETERRIHEEMKARGIPAEALQIATKH